MQSTYFFSVYFFLQKLRKIPQKVKLHKSIYVSIKTITVRVGNSLIRNWRICCLDVIVFVSRVLVASLTKSEHI